MRKYKTYKEIRSTFSPESQQRIAAGAQKIKEELRILETVGEMAGISPDELAERFNIEPLDLSPVEGQENITFNKLLAIISALGGSVDIVINFPEKDPAHFSEVETFLYPNAVDLGEK
ncbi:MULTISPECIES: hypothetical protein [Roseofilum]|uniref:Transcriptional regulator n=2 Tax=Roseofilum TaxID=1233426 RepID=A0ABT7B9Q3_9CYAN|nr:MULTISPECIES: hypothetical protein [Roseofilum]MDJ1169185.1 hypothetical protein [Roseofilum acuticapitatum BLCC-M154]MDJ1175236.1 hypothetical protein [Roseofilum capinflatum BLCC-M114]